MVLIIDNYDSFTYNLVQYIAKLGMQLQVVRNDEITITDIAKQKPKHILISPGPCTPNESGISLAVIEAFSGKIPILGVCLGHQTIGQYYGAAIVYARKIMHGKVSNIFHKGVGVFAGIPTPYQATRYHSLVIDKKTLTDCLEITAWTQSVEGDVDEIMGIRHKKYKIEGVQFHPEAILTEYGYELLNNFLQS
jgi:anthranilate synthase component 2